MKTFNKGEFVTVEAFYFTVEDGEIYEEDRNEDLDTFWHDELGSELMDFVLEECKERLGEEPSIVDVLPRRWAELDEDGNLEDYGDSCLGSERYMWTGERLVRESEYL